MCAKGGRAGPPLDAGPDQLARDVRAARTVAQIHSALPNLAGAQARRVARGDLYAARPGQGRLPLRIGQIAPFNVQMECRVMHQTAQRAGGQGGRQINARAQVRVARIGPRGRSGPHRAIPPACARKRPPPAAPATGHPAGRRAHHSAHPCPVAPEGPRGQLLPPGSGPITRPRPSCA